MLVGWLVCQQGYTKSTKQISIELGWKIPAQNSPINFSTVCSTVCENKGQRETDLLSL